MLVVMLYGARDCTARCCGHPRFKKVRVAKFLDVQLVDGEDVVTNDPHQEQMTAVERDFVQGEENLKAEARAEQIRIESSENQNDIEHSLGTRSVS